MAAKINSLRMSAITKRFPGVLANDAVDFDVQAGEIHALLGENGAGKSTLMKQLCGLYKPDGGRILINDAEVMFDSPSDSIAAGIGMIHQHFMLVPSLTVTENVALGMPAGGGGVLDYKGIRAQVAELASRYGLKVNPDAYIWQLSVGEQQRVEIIKALYRGAQVLALDEPTAVLTPQEVRELFVVLRNMAADGRALIFISHKLHEIIDISQRVTVMRDGRVVASHATEGSTRAQLASEMVGRPVVLSYEKMAAQPGETLLDIRNLTVGGDRGADAVRDVSLAVRAGEIVGIAGVSGNGQRELAEALAGIRPVKTGAVSLAGTPITNANPAARIKHGLAAIPEERMREGVVREFSVAENLMLQDHARAPYSRNGLLNFEAIAREGNRLVDAYKVKTPSLDTPIKNLSGGNIQKVILARELARNPRVLIAAQPTRGVDIGASEYIHQRLLESRAAGKAILLISEDLDEVRALSDRIAVMFDGRIVSVVDAASATAEHLGLLMAGVTS